MRENIIYIDDVELYKDSNWDCLLKPRSLISFSEEKRYTNILCVGIRKIIDDNYVAHFPHLKYILSPSTGLDHIKIINDNIKIISLNPSDVDDINASSEFTFLLILSILKKFPRVLSGEIRTDAEDLQNKTLGILGYGRIGKKVAKYAESMGANVIWHDINGGVSKDEIFKESDIVLVAVNCTEENRKYISKEDFEKMSAKKPYFINITRGFVVDEEALINALDNDQVVAVALDVVEDKRRFSKYLYHCDSRVIITPHVAGTTIQSRQKACNYVINKLFDILINKNED